MPSNYTGHVFAAEGRRPAKSSSLSSAGELDLAGLFAETPGSYRTARVVLAGLEVALLRSKARREERKNGCRKFPEGDRKP